MARHGGDSARRMADRVSTSTRENDRFHQLYYQQRFVGDLGRTRRRLRADRPAVLPMRHESSRVQKES